MNVRVITVTDSEHSAPQPRYVQLDLECGLLTAGYNTGIGNALPIAVYQGRVLRWPISTSTADEVNALMERLLPIAEIARAEYERVWNGNNFVGKYTETGWEAIQEIRNMLDLEPAIRTIR